MRLTDTQVLNPLWTLLRAHYTERLAQLRKDNDNLALTEKDSATLRGRIAEVKAFLEMDSPEPEQITVAGLE
jgi:hypothetical protein